MKKEETSVERVLVKLNDLLYKRFGVKAEYIPLYGAEKHNKAAIAMVKRNAGAPMILAHNELVVPIRVDGVLAGATRVEEINRLNPKDIAQIRDTIDLLLTEVMAARRRVEILAITEDLITNNNDNVITLDERRSLAREAATH